MFDVCILYEDIGVAHFIYIHISIYIYIIYIYKLPHHIYLYDIYMISI